MIHVLVSILLIIATEAITEIIVASEFPLFYWFRNWWTIYTFPPEGPPRTGKIQHVRVSIHKLVTCGYCMSVWVSAFFAIWTSFDYFGNTFINWLVSVFFIHRLSNWLHVFFELTKRGRVKSYDIELRVKTDEHEEDEDGSA